MTKRRRGHDADAPSPAPTASQGTAPCASFPVDTIDTSDVCRSDEEMLALPGRIVIGIVLRAHLDQRRITVFELLFDHAKLTELSEQKGVLENAMVRIAAVQARVLGEDVTVRQAVMMAVHQKCLLEAKRTKEALSALDRSQGLVKAVVRAGIAADTGLLRAAFAGDLGTQRTWPLKLALVLETVAGLEPIGSLAATADECLADILAIPAALVAILGNPPTLGDRVLRLLALAEGGSPDWPVETGADLVARMTSLIRAGRLSVVRAACYDRIRRLLKCPEALFPGDPAREQTVFGDLLVRLVTERGVTGGPVMAEALTRRYARLLDRGGASGMRLAITGSIEALPGFIPRIQYLTALASVDLGPRVAADVLEVLEATVKNEAVLDLAWGNYQPFKQVLAVAQDCVRQTPMVATVRNRLLDHLDAPFDALAISGGLMAVIARRESAVTRRALLAAELLESGLVRSDEAKQKIKSFLADFARRAGAVVGPVAASGEGSAGGDKGQVCGPAPRAGGHVDVVQERTTLRPQPRRGPPAVATVDGPGVSPAKAAGTVANGLCINCMSLKPGPGLCAVCGFDAASPQTGRPHLAPGTWLNGRYRVGRVLGQGGFGATYIGWDERLCLKVAIKECFPVSLVSRATDGLALVPYGAEQGDNFKTCIVKFLDEARMLARLRAVTEIVSVHDFFEENETAYLVMEYLEGRTLKQCLQEDGPMDIRKALGHLFPIMRALHQVHAQGLIHRDVSPDNVFLTVSGERKLLDFGAARQAAGEAMNNMTVILKPGYAPPEQYYSDGRQGPWTDVYGMAATIYFSIVGKPPPDVARRFQSDTLVPITTAGGPVSADLERVLGRGLGMKVEERPASMKAFAALLSKAIS